MLLDQCVQITVADEAPGQRIRIALRYGLFTVRAKEFSRTIRLSGFRRLAGADLQTHVGDRQRLDHPPRLAARFPSDQTSALDHPRIVEDQQIAWPDKLGKVGKLAIMARPCHQMQQSAGGALTGRWLGNQFQEAGENRSRRA